MFKKGQTFYEKEYEKTPEITKEFKEILNRQFKIHIFAEKYQKVCWKGGQYDKTFLPVLGQLHP